MKEKNSVLLDKENKNANKKVKFKFSNSSYGSILSLEDVLSNF